MVLELSPEIVHNLVTPIWVKGWFTFFYHRHHLFSEKSVGRHELELAWGLDLHMLLRTQIFVLMTRQRLVLKAFTKLVERIICKKFRTVDQERKFDLMNFLLERIDGCIIVFDLSVILEVSLPGLYFELVSLLLSQMIEPLGLDELVDLPAKLVRVLIFEHIEVLILKNLVSSRRSSWSYLLKFLNLVLKTLY